MADATIELQPLATLVLGGARSGKSNYAESLVAGAPRPVYLATAEAGDAEMAARIKAHRARRGDTWRTLEEPLEIAAAIEDVAGPESPVLVDCLTLWLSNLMAAGRDVDAEAQALTDALQWVSGPVVLVSNEVGGGIVPENALARAYRDHAGQMNQTVAAVCGRVVLVVAGVPLVLRDGDGGVEA